MITSSLVLMAALTLGAGAEGSLPSFDFRRAAELQGWVAQHDLAPLAATPDGMALTITGSDPYLSGPPRDYPPGVPLVLKLRLRSDLGGTGQIFYFDRNHGTTEEHSVHFDCRGGSWEDVSVDLPPLGPGFRLRIDPPGQEGHCTLATLTFARSGSSRPHRGPGLKCRTLRRARSR